MKCIVSLCIAFINFLPGYAFAQTNASQIKTEILTLGVFHFEYPNLDVVQVEEENQISVLGESFQAEIQKIVDVLEEFNPTIIAVEVLPDQQSGIDSLYSLYRSDQLELSKNEVQQIGFRLANQLGLEKIYAVDDMGKHYPHIEELHADNARRSSFEHFHSNFPDSLYRTQSENYKVTSIIKELIALNHPEEIKERLGVYLLNPFTYEEEPGDYTGVDFETGRWFNRNLRIFRNIQRIAGNQDDRILLIIGRDHLSLLNHFFETSMEFDLVPALPYLWQAQDERN